MTMTPREIEHKVRQLDNDVHEIYVMLSAISGTQGRHTNRLNELQAMIAGHDARFDAHDARFDAHDARFDAHDARFDAHDARFDAHDARFDAIDEQLTEILRRLPG